MDHAPPSLVNDDFTNLDFVASPVFVLRLDASGIPRYVAFNANARATSGKPLSHYLGKTAQEVYEGAYGLTAFKRHCEVATSGQPMTYEIDLPLKGETRIIRTTLLPRRDENGRVTTLFGTSIDLTQERNNDEAHASLKTVTTEMEQFVAMAAHDLRAPLRNVAMIADMLNEGFVDHGDGKAELIEMLETISSKSMSLISDVLDHARAIEVVDTRTKFNFAALCRDICDVLDPHALHQFTYTAVELVADRTAMQIAVRNIIDNAIKYGQRDALKIDIIVQRGDDGMLDVVMTDSGAGFGEAALRFVNGGGFRVESGYGLLGVRRLVESRGGTLTANDLEDAKGAIIRFSLPGEWVGATNSLGDLLANWTVLEIKEPSKIA